MCPGAAVVADVCRDERYVVRLIDSGQQPFEVPVFEPLVSQPVVFRLCAFRLSGKAQSAEPEMFRQLVDRLLAVHASS